MSDLISKEKLIEAIKQRMKAHESDAVNLADENFQCDSEELFLRLADECQAVIEVIEEQPTVDPVHGEWKDELYRPYPIYECSECGALAPKDCEGEEFYKSNFCPNC